MCDASNSSSMTLAIHHRSLCSVPMGPFSVWPVGPDGLCLTWCSQFIIKVSVWSFYIRPMGLRRLTCHVYLRKPSASNLWDHGTALQLHSTYGIRQLVCNLMLAVCHKSLHLVLLHLTYGTRMAYMSCVPMGPFSISILWDHGTTLHLHSSCETSWLA